MEVPMSPASDCSEGEVIRSAPLYRDAVLIVPLNCLSQLPAHVVLKTINDLSGEIYWIRDFGFLECLKFLG